MGGASLHDLDDLDRGLAPEARGKPGRERPRAAGDPDVGATEAPLAHQGGDDLARRGVDRNGEAEAEAGDRRVDADDLRLCVGERAARVAGVERSVGLDHVLDDAALRNRQRPAERRDNAGRQRSAEAERAADRDHELADAQPVGVAELGGREAVRVESQDGEIGERIGADELELVLASVDEGGAARAVGLRDDVCRGEQEPVRRDDDRAAASVEPAAAADPAGDAQAGDRWSELFGDGGDCVRVGVERLGLARRIGDELQLRHRLRS